MTKAEMILKVVMAPTDPAKAFTDQFAKLLPEAELSEFQKVLDMKVGHMSADTSLLSLNSLPTGIFSSIFITNH
jgi:hypothetical protein